MLYLKMILLINILINFFFISGKLFLNQIFKNHQTDNSLTLLIGLSISLILLNLFYFIIGLSLNNFFYLMIFLTFLSTFLWKFNFKEIIKFSIIFRFFIISLLIATIANFVPEQVFIFRGNYWDKINYVNAAYSIYHYDFNEIINFSDKSYNL